MKLVHLLSSAALALAAPSMIDGTGIPALDDAGAVYAKNGNGNGNGNGNNGNGGNGKGAGKSDKGANASGYTKQKGGGQGKAKTARSQTKLDKRVNKALQKLGLAKKSTNAASQERKVKASQTARASNAPTKSAPLATVRPTAAPKEKNLHAQLKGLNSLNRNANGFFNGNDPKLDPLRDFVATSVAGEALLSDLSNAEENVAAQEDKLAGVLNDLGITVEEEMTTQEALDAARADLLENEPDLDADGRAAWEDELAQFDAAQTAVDELDALNDTLEEAQIAVDESADDTSEDSLREAIAASFAAHGNHAIAPEDISDEVVDFVSDKLGVGEAEGFIDVAISQAEAADNEDEIDPLEEAEADPGDEEPILLTDET